MVRPITSQDTDDSTVEVVVETAISLDLSDKKMRTLAINRRSPSSDSSSYESEQVPLPSEEYFQNNAMLNHDQDEDGGEFSSEQHSDEDGNTRNLTLSTSGQGVKLSIEETHALLQRSGSYRSHQEDHVHENAAAVIFRVNSEHPEYHGELFLAPQRSIVPETLELKILKSHDKLPEHIKIISTALRVDTKTGEVTLVELEQPKILKKIDSDDADDEFSSDEVTTAKKEKVEDGLDLEFDPTQFPEVEVSDYEDSEPEDEQEVANDSSDEDTPVDKHINQQAKIPSSTLKFFTDIGDEKECPIAALQNTEENVTPDTELNKNDLQKNSEGELSSNEDDYTSVKKVIPVNLQLKEEVKRELECRKILSGDGACPIQIIIVGKTCYIIDDLIPGKTLTEVLKDKFQRPQQYTNQKILNLMTNAVKAVKYVHDNDIVHGDIKPDNLMVAPDESSMQLIDFGGSAPVSFKKLIDYTRIYVPPEYSELANTKQDLPRDKKIDMYALGFVLLHCLLLAWDKNGYQERNIRKNRTQKSTVNTYDLSLQHPILAYLDQYINEFIPGLKESRVNLIPEKADNTFFKKWQAKRLEDINKEIEDNPYYRPQTPEKTYAALEEEFIKLAMDIFEETTALSNCLDTLGTMSNPTEEVDEFSASNLAGTMLLDLLKGLFNAAPEQRTPDCETVLEKLHKIQEKFNKSAENFQSVKEKIILPSRTQYLANVLLFRKQKENSEFSCSEASCNNSHRMSGL